MCTLKDTRVKFSDAFKSLPTLPERALILQNLSQENHIKRMALARRKVESPNAVFISSSNCSKLISKIGEPKDISTEPTPHKITNCKTKTIKLSSNDKLKNTKGNIQKSVQMNSYTGSSGMFSHFVLPKLSDSCNVTKHQDEKSHNSPVGKNLYKPSLTNSKQASEKSEMSSKKKTLLPNKLSNKKTKKAKAIDANVDKLQTVSKIPVLSRTRKKAPFKNASNKLTNEFKKSLKTTKSESNNYKNAVKKGNMIDYSFDNSLPSFPLKEDIISYNQNNCTNITCSDIASNKSVNDKKLPEGKQIKKNTTNKSTKDEKNAMTDLRFKMTLRSENKEIEQSPILIRSSSLNVLDDYKQTKPLNKAKKSSSKIYNCTKPSRIPVPLSRIEKMRNKQNYFEGESNVFYEFVDEKNASIPSFHFDTKMKHRTPPEDRSTDVLFSKENVEDINETPSTDDSHSIDQNKITKNTVSEAECSGITSYLVGGNITVDGQTEEFQDSKIANSSPHLDVGCDGTNWDMKLQGTNSAELDPKEYNVGSHQFPACTVSQESSESKSRINVMGSDTNFSNIAISKFEPHFTLSEADFLTKPIEKFMNEIKTAMHISDSDELNTGSEANTNKRKGLKGKKSKKGRKTGNKQKISRWCSTD